MSARKKNCDLFYNDNPGNVGTALVLRAAGALPKS
jgi:hypothetical protein